MVVGVGNLSNCVWLCVPCVLAVVFALRPRANKTKDAWFMALLALETAYVLFPHLVLLIAVCSIVVWGTGVGDLRRFARMSGDRRGCALVAVALCVASLVARIVLPISLPSIALSCASLVAACSSLSNADQLIDARTGALKREGMQEAISLRLDRGAKVGALGVVLERYEALRMLNGEDKMNQALTLMVSCLRDYPGVDVSYMGRGRLLAAGDETFDPQAAAERMTRRFMEPWQVQGVPLTIGACMAVLPPTDRMTSGREVFVTMNSAMDEALLQEGETSVLVDDTALDRLDEHAHVRRVLEDAIQNNKVEVYLQPLYSTRKHRITRAEALARLRDENGEFISPETFIGIAEGAGVIDRLGEQLFQKVCAFAARYDLDALGIECINVNLSPLQCMSSELPENLHTIAREYGVDMERFHLEITESAMVDVSVLREQMGVLITTGSQFSLDDYGTGYSNLTRMASLPFANVKLDHSIVWDYFSGKSTIMQSLISAFHEQGLEVTAEGVETKQMAEELERLECDLLQGFYFSRALPPEDFVEYVLEQG